MGKVFLITATIILNSCIPDIAPRKTVIKSVKVGDTEIEWFSGSASYVDVPDIITITNGNVTDTICRSTNLADLRIAGNNTIVVGFYGEPKQWENIIKLPKKILDFNIVVDASCIYKSKTGS